MEDTGSYVHFINTFLKNIKSNLYAEYIWPCIGDISIVTNNVLASSNLNTIEQYLKSIESINHNKVMPPTYPSWSHTLRL